MRNLVLFFLAFALVGFPSFGLAKLGVGVNTGKITVEEPLKAGGVYELPPLVVINTGDEPSFYGASIEYHVNQPEYRPERSWFRFTPETFHLEPGAVQKVGVQLTLPVQAPPGDYFAYVEGHPVYEDTGSGVSRIGIAAAGKLYFTVAPATIFQGIYWRLLYFWNKFSPWTYIALVIVGGALFLVVMRRFFSFNIGLRKSMKQESLQIHEENDEEYEEIGMRRPRKQTRKTAARKTSTRRKE